MIRVAPFLLRPGQSRFENVLVTYSWQASMFASWSLWMASTTVRVSHFGSGPGRLATGYFANFRSGVAVLLSSFWGDSQGPFGVRIVGRQENATSVSTARTRSPASAGRSAMSFGSVALTEPPA